MEMSSPWPEDYYIPVVEMDTNHILKSTLTGESRQQKGDSRTCLLCGFSYFLSDDDDDPPNRVSDSESESESEQDSD